MVLGRDPRALSAVPVLALVAVLTGVALRIRLTLPVCAGIAASILVAGTALLLVVNLYVEYGQHARDSQAVARTVQFTTYEPRPLPPRFVLQRSAAAAGRDAPAIHAFYALTGNGWASVTQERPPGDRRTRYSRTCLLEGAGDRCREVRSSKGHRVMLAKGRPGLRRGVGAARRHPGEHHRRRAHRARRARLHRRAAADRSR